MKLKGYRYKCKKCGHLADVIAFGEDEKCPICGSEEVCQNDEVLEITREWVFDILVKRDIRMIFEDCANGASDYLDAIFRCEGTKPIGMFSISELEEEFGNVFDQDVLIFTEECFETKYGFVPELDGTNFDGEPYGDEN